ncbi:MAG: methyltransferase domain-containing protein [Deltaproteobacteria bacterium]|nr:methyltransferase domain-containing protein [Deltaproteobacteria bacterium]
MDTHICPWWLAYTFDHRLRLWVHNPEKLFGKYVRLDMTVIDLGCGLGFNSMGLAGLVGNSGKVVALDIQQKMLDVVMKRAKKRGIENRIEPHLALKNDFNLHVKVQFILAFYMVHEVPDPNRLMAQVADNLSVGGLFMMVEPPFHVSKREFHKSIAQIEKSGLVLEESYKILFGRTAVLRKPAIPG